MDASSLNTEKHSWHTLFNIASSFGVHISRENSQKEFELTKKQFHTRTKALSYHLIQFFVQG